jgi:diadenosine tetraphosphatase ApaH/serine/threonine PP2A family protein phosphatase
MKYAIVSDIHANDIALEAVLDHADETHGTIPLLCLGDIVGYGPRPNETVAIVRERALSTVVGNHDLACANGTGIERFNVHAAASALWTRENLTSANVDWLLSLPFTVDKPAYSIVHGSPKDPAAFEYVTDRWSARDAFDATRARLTFIGHTHVPQLFREWDYTSIERIRRTPPASCDFVETGVNGDNRYLVNVGSVGQPRDRDPRASYAVYDDERLTVTWFRVPYSAAAVAEAIALTDLPQSCGERLLVGR